MKSASKAAIVEKVVDNRSFRAEKRPQVAQKGASERVPRDLSADEKVDQDIVECCTIGRRSPQRPGESRHKLERISDRNLEMRNVEAKVQPGEFDDVWINLDSQYRVRAKLPGQQVNDRSSTDTKDERAPRGAIWQEHRPDAWTK